MTTALVVLTAAAIFCALARGEHTFSYWAIISVTFFVAACLFARCAESANLAWGFITVGWLIAMVDVIHSQIGSFDTFNGPPPAHEMQTRIWLAYGSGVALPLFLSFPAVYLTTKAGGCSRYRTRKWMVACVVLAVANCTLISVSLTIILARGWPW